MIDEIQMTYSQFKDILAAKKIRHQHLEMDTQYLLWAYDSIQKYNTSIWKVNPGIVGLDWAQEQVNLADFETNYKPTSNRSLQTSPVAALSKFHGRTIELASEDTSRYCEWSFDADVEINKVLPRPINAEWGDYLTMEVWARPGVMGPDAVKVEDFGSGIYIMSGDGSSGNWYEGSGGGKVPGYCTVRCYYHKAAGTARKFIIDAEFLV